MGGPSRAWGEGVGAWRLRVALALACAAAAAPACDPPVLLRDGTFAFPEKGAGSIAVLGANGLELRDRVRLPVPVVRRDPFEPFRSPIGFLLPTDGVFRASSRATVLTAPGLVVVLRPSDERVPSWGGEVLVRVDVVAPASPDVARRGEDVVVEIDGPGDDAAVLVDAALEHLAARDRIAVRDARTGRLVLGFVPASHRALVTGLVARASSRARAPAAPPGARVPSPTLVALLAGREPSVTRRVLRLVGRGGGVASAAEARELGQLAAGGVPVAVISASPDAEPTRLASLAGAVGTAPVVGTLAARAAGVRELVPPPGPVRFGDVRLRFEATPAPTHVLEASSGDVLWQLDAGEVHLGALRAGEARTDVLRVSVPPWVPGEPFRFGVRVVLAGAEDAPAPAGPMEVTCALEGVYDDDLGRLADRRHGDVLVYATGLALARRLDARVFDRRGTDARLLALARTQAASLDRFARDTSDVAAREQADLLAGVLAGLSAAGR